MRHINILAVISCAALSAASIVLAPAGAVAADADYAPQAAPFSSVVWAGVDLKNNVAAGYVGGNYAVGGDLGKSGVLLRGQYVYAGWTNSAFIGNGAGSLNNANLSVGYQMVGAGLTAQGFVGADYQNYAFNPANATVNLNTRMGALFTGRLATTNSAFPVALDGSYSTANNAYWVKLSPGIRLSNAIVGPEAIVFGNRSYSEYRLGGFLNYHLSSNLIANFDVGYAQTTYVFGSNPSGRNGAYGGVTLVLLR